MIIWTVTKMTLSHIIFVLTDIQMAHTQPPPLHLARGGGTRVTEYLLKSDLHKLFITFLSFFMLQHHL